MAAGPSFNLINSIVMAKKTYEELVQLKQDGKIGWLEFVQLGDDAEEFFVWCDEHNERPTEANAELFMEMKERQVVSELNEEEM
jgi:hypothetical protein